jgi:signal transduction histidine kinase
MPALRKKFPPELIDEILNMVHNAILLINPAQEIFFANSRTARMFKTDVENLQSQKFEQIFMPEDREIMLPNILKKSRENGEFETEVMLRCFDGSSFLGLISCSYFLWDGEGCMAVTIHNLSKMKTLERMLEHSAHITFLGHMLDDINHQIRNPVLVIGGLARRLTTESHNRKYAETIIKEANRLEALLDTLNSFIMLPRPKQLPRKLSEVITQIEGRFKPLAESYGARWNCDCPPQILDKTILTDLPLLLEAIEALVRNACEAYEPESDKKNVLVEISENADATWPYCISVTDRGEGIKEERLPHVMSHFFSEKTKHLGMGLTFAQRIVEEQKGKIVISSRLGHGTTVSIFLITDRRRLLRTKKL